MGDLEVTGRLAVGLGNKNAIETGTTLHHIYGVPIIPGAALKGLSAHYCHQVWGQADPEFKLGGIHHETLFGTQEDAGHIIFYDAWIEPECLTEEAFGLVFDVMTPHHSAYYGAGEGVDSVVPPTDFDNPNPVPFFSVRGRFLVALSCDAAGEAAGKWRDLAFGLLCEALRDWGVGGKTSSGYGRLVPPGGVRLETERASS